MVRAKKPSQGAPASGPGRMSQRTDLSPASQPVRAPTGQPYGQRGAMVAQQQAAPTRAVQPTDASTPPSAAVPPGLLGGAFGPTQRPGEDINTPPPATPGSAEADPDFLLRAMYKRYPHPDLQRLLLRRAR